MSVVNDIHQRYQARMMTEMTKFVDVYNQLSDNPIDFTKVTDYALVIRVLGNYISNLDLDNWLSTKMVFSDEIEVDMSVFSLSLYQPRVRSFLEQLKNAFYQCLTTEIETYLSTTRDFTDEEKVICRLFWEKADAVTQAMRRTAFTNLERSVMDRQNIDTYSSELRQFNVYTQELAKTPGMMQVIHRFDRVIKRIATEKPPVDIFFDA